MLNLRKVQGWRVTGNISGLIVVTYARHDVVERSPNTGINAYG